jgi:HD-GYP domain-containing protein (c-di-GMP phosphodiesterase class II)
MVALADGFDARTNDRPYRRALSVEQAMLILRQESGRQWDAKLVETFLEIIADRHALQPTLVLSSQRRHLQEIEELQMTAS